MKFIFFYFHLATAPHGFFFKVSAEQVPEAVQIGGLHSGLSQLAGSWHGYRYRSSHAVRINNKDKIMYLILPSLKMQHHQQLLSTPLISQLPLLLASCFLLLSLGCVHLEQHVLLPSYMLLSEQDSS